MNNDLHFSSKTAEWSTPQDLFDRLNQKHHFTLDVAASHENAKCEFYCTKDGTFFKGIDDPWGRYNGLEMPWIDEVCWMNPPYNDLKSWVAKAFFEAKRGAKVVALLPSRTDTEAFHRYILPFSGINSTKPVYAWAAGIVDGEGCIRIDKGNPTKANRLANPTYALCVSVKMTDFPTIEKLHDQFGGSISIEKHKDKRDTKRWEIRGEEAKTTLELLYPHLVTKQIQAQMGIEFQLSKQAKKGKKVSQEYLNAQEELYKSISAIKKEHSVPGVRTSIEFLKGRLKFGGSTNSAPFPSMIVIFSP